jgi:hypothetical protein
MRSAYEVRPLTDMRFRHKKIVADADDAPKAKRTRLTLESLADQREAEIDSALGVAVSSASAQPAVAQTSPPDPGIDHTDLASPARDARGEVVPMRSFGCRALGVAV